MGESPWLGGSQTRVCDTGPQVTPSSLFRRGSQRHSAIRTNWRGTVPGQAFLPIWRQLILPVHLLFLAPLLGCSGGRSCPSRKVKGYVADFLEELQEGTFPEGKAPIRNFVTGIEIVEDEAVPA